MGRGGLLSSSLDKGWFEASGGQGVRRLAETGGHNLEGLSLKTYKSHIAFGFFAITALSILFSINTC